MRSMFLGLATVMMCSVTVQAAQSMVSSYYVPITRDGKTTAMVTYNFWSGEWPVPVVNVQSETDSTTTISAYESLRTLDKPVACTIKNGLYHPWGSSPSLINFYSIVPESSYEVRDDVLGFSYDDAYGVAKTIDLKAGSLIEREVYLSEGYCQIAIPVKGQHVDVTVSCDQMSDTAKFTPIVGGGENEQWLYLQCEEGHKAFVRDEAILKQPGVTQGQFGDYGTVKP